MDKTYAPAAAQESVLYDGKLPLIASEYGGMAYSCKGKNWGYHTFDSEEDFLAEYLGMTKSYLSCEKISGFCYTQLYDVEQEQNGLFFYDRKRKFSDRILKEIADCNKLAAAIEK